MGCDVQSCTENLVITAIYFCFCLFQYFLESIADENPSPLNTTPCSLVSNWTHSKEGSFFQNVRNCLPGEME
jgi:hypothetical protein